MKWLLSIATGMLLTVELAVAQTAPPVFYAESFRKGPTRVTEDMFEIKLTSENPTYTQRIRDSAGAEHYELAVTPKIGEGEGNDKITSWEVSLRDLRHSIYGNVLQFDRELSENPKDNLYWLNPQPTAAVPMRARRIIKVEGFYIAFQVTDLHYSPADSPYIGRMTIQMELSNHDPRPQTPVN